MTSPNPRAAPVSATASVYDSWCLTEGAGHSCVNDAAHEPSRFSAQVKMFWKTPRSWLNDSSTMNELSRISHSRDGSGFCARAGAAASSAASATSAIRNHDGTKRHEDHEEQFVQTGLRALRASSCLRGSVRMSARIDFDQQLGGGAGADRDLPILAPQHHRVGGGVARLDLHRLARLEIVALDEAQERRILIRDPRDPQRRADRAGQQVLEM